MLFPSNEKISINLENTYRRFQICCKNQEEIKQFRASVLRDVNESCIFGFYEGDINLIQSATEVAYAILGKCPNDDLNSILSSYDPFWIIEGYEYSKKVNEKGFGNFYKRQFLTHEKIIMLNIVSQLFSIENKFFLCKSEINTKIQIYCAVQECHRIYQKFLEYDSLTDTRLQCLKDYVVRIQVEEPPVKNDRIYACFVTCPKQFLSLYYQEMFEGELFTKTAFISHSAYYKDIKKKVGFELLIKKVYGKAAYKALLNTCKTFYKQFKQKETHFVKKLYPFTEAIYYLMPVKFAKYKNECTESSWIKFMEAETEAFSDMSKTNAVYYCKKAWEKRVLNLKGDKWLTVSNKINISEEKILQWISDSLERISIDLAIHFFDIDLLQKALHSKLKVPKSICYLKENSFQRTPFLEKLHQKELSSKEVDSFIRGLRVYASPALEKLHRARSKGNLYNLVVRIEEKASETTLYEEKISLSFDSKAEIFEEKVHEKSTYLYIPKDWTDKKKRETAESWFDKKCGTRDPSTIKDKKKFGSIKFDSDEGLKLLTQLDFSNKIDACTFPKSWTDDQRREGIINWLINLNHTCESGLTNSEHSEDSTDSLKKSSRSSKNRVYIFPWNWTNDKKKTVVEWCSRTIKDSELSVDSASDKFYFINPKGWKTGVEVKVKPIEEVFRIASVNEEEKKEEDAKRVLICPDSWTSTEKKEAIINWLTHQNWIFDSNTKVITGELKRNKEQFKKIISKYNKIMRFSVNGVLFARNNQQRKIFMKNLLQIASALYKDNNFLFLHALMTPLDGFAAITRLDIFRKLFSSAKLDPLKEIFSATDRFNFYFRILNKCSDSIPYFGAFFYFLEWTQQTGRMSYSNLEVFENEKMQFKPFKNEISIKDKNAEVIASELLDVIVSDVSDDVLWEMSYKIQPPVHEETKNTSIKCLDLEKSFSSFSEIPFNEIESDLSRKITFLYTNLASCESDNDYQIRSKMEKLHEFYLAIRNFFLCILRETKEPEKIPLTLENILYQGETFLKSKNTFASSAILEVMQKYKSVYNAHEDLKKRYHLFKTSVNKLKKKSKILKSKPCLPYPFFFDESTNELLDLSKSYTDPFEKFKKMVFLYIRNQDDECSSIEPTKRETMILECIDNELKQLKNMKLIHEYSPLRKPTSFTMNRKPRPGKILSMKPQNSFNRKINES